MAKRLTRRTGRREKQSAVAIFGRGPRIRDLLKTENSGDLWILFVRFSSLFVSRFLRHESRRSDSPDRVGVSLAARALPRAFLATGLIFFVQFCDQALVRDSCAQHESMAVAAQELR